MIAGYTADEIARLRDQYALAAYPLALQGSHKGYGHLCDVVSERAIRDAYIAADVAIEYIKKNGRPA